MLLTLVNQWVIHLFDNNIDCYKKMTNSTEMITNSINAFLFIDDLNFLSLKVTSTKYFLS